MHNDAYLRIGELAAALGTTTKTLRFYERAGLLDPGRRAPNGYRQYDTLAVERARMLVELRRLGFTVRELQSLVNAGDEQALRRVLLALMDEKIRATELALSVTQGRYDDLNARYQALLLTPRSRPPNCVCDALLTTCHCGRAA